MAVLRTAYTAADVRAAGAAGVREVVLPAGAVVTPLARDTAAELGVTLLPAAVTSQATPPVPRGPMVKHVDARAVTLQRFGHRGPEPGQDVFCGDVVTADDGSPMAAGFLTLTRGCFPWTLTYDEVEYVVEGELHIGVGDRTVVGRPGDVLFVPKGTSITFGTPSWAKFLYVTFPADWEGELS